MATGQQERCQICSARSLERIMSFGKQPPIHAHLTKDQLDQSETMFPINLCRCTSCGLVQLEYIPDPKVIFHPDYPYQTGMTKMLVENFRSLAKSAIKKYGIRNGDLVVDIGSNDGSLLKEFQAEGMKVAGVEPTKAALVAERNGIPTVNDFFTEHVAKKMAAAHGKAKIITATNVFAHVNDLGGMMSGIRQLLDDDGVFISESQYLADIVEKLEFDTVYDEHLRYYSLRPLKLLFEKFGFSLADAERIPAAGGSIRVYAVKGRAATSDRASRLMEDEERMGLYDKKTYDAFSRRIAEAKEEIWRIIRKCEGTIAGFGAPGRSNALLGYFQIDNKVLKYLCEKKGSPKIGMYTPGTHIPIVDEEMLFREQPEYVILLSWHIGDELTAKLRELGYKGRIIIPLPEPRIVEPI